VKRLQGPNQSGQAYAFMALTPIVPAEVDALRTYLHGFLDRGDPSPLSRLPRTHFGRWVIVPDFVNDPSQPKEDHLGGPYLVFTSSFDGPLGSYLDELCRELATEAKEIWGRCIGCPPSASGPDLKRYLLHNQIDTGFFVAAYPEATVADVRTALNTRDELIAFALEAETLEPEQLRTRFLARFGS